MAKTFFPFDAGAGANVTEAQWAEMATLWRDTGVHPTLLDKLETFADSTGMQVKVKSGVAWMEGFFFKSDAQETLAIAASNPTNPRIDRVVVRLDRVNNNVDLAVLTGTPAVSPTPPTLTQTSTIWEISLAQVLVGTGVTTIAAGNVTNERTYSYPGEATATPTASKIPIADAAGTLNAWLISGTYTPTLTNVTNIAASTAYVCQYMRVGNVVTVSGRVIVDPTATGACELGITLPIASNLAGAEQCSGAGAAFAVAGFSVAMMRDTANNRVTMQWVAADIAARVVYFTFTYLIV